MWTSGVLVASSAPKNLPADLPDWLEMPWDLVALNDGTILDCKSKVAFTLMEHQGNRSCYLLEQQQEDRKMANSRPASLPK